MLLPACGLAVTAAPGTGSTSLLARFASSASARAVPSADIVVDGAVVIDAKHAPISTLIAAGLLDPGSIARLRVVTSTRSPFDFWAAEWHRTRTRWRDEIALPSSWVHRQPGMIQRVADAVELDFGDWLEVSLGAHRRAGRTMHLNPAHIAEADVVLRMEHLDADIAHLGPDVDGVPVPHVNATHGRRPYREMYTAAARDLVEEVHAPDLARFGYRF